VRLCPLLLMSPDMFSSLSRERECLAIRPPRSSLARERSSVLPLPRFTAGCPPALRTISLTHAAQSEAAGAGARERETNTNLLYRRESRTRLRYVLLISHLSRGHSPPARPPWGSFICLIDLMPAYVCLAV
jgi:hypothetical protein